MSLVRADARQLPLVDGCVQTCVTSPPYFGLRDYGNAGQIGLEPSPDAYVQSLLTVFAEVWRVLKDDGTLWLNLGDSYAGGGGFCPTAPSNLAGAKQTTMRGAPGAKGIKVLPGMKSKDLLGIPWRVAFALQAAGWYLRSDIIWSKPNPMPESVTDRPTKAHEYIFLLSKQERYYYNGPAIREPYAASTLTQFDKAYTGQATKEYAAVGVQNPSEIKRRITDKQRGHGRRHAGFNDRWDAMPKVEQQTNGANKRSVWHVATQPYSGSHFATFPEALIEPCILAGSRPGDLVLDPFVGSGTVGTVCELFGRRWVGTDLTYQHLAKKRTRQRGLRFSA